MTLCCCWFTSLAVGGAVGLDGPAGLVAERLEHLVVVAVLGEVVVAVGPEAGEDLGGDRAAAALPVAVVLALPPRRDPGAPEPAAAPRAARHRRPGRRISRICPGLLLAAAAGLARPLALFIISGEELGGGAGGAGGEEEVVV